MTTDTADDSEKLIYSILVNEETIHDMEALHHIRMLKNQLEEQGHTVVFDDEASWMARGRAADCDCQLLQCVCVEARQHKTECHWRKVLLAPIGFPCEPHGLEECPTCDACTCKDLP
jgi:hypothetical protein